MDGRKVSKTVYWANVSGDDIRLGDLYERDGNNLIPHDNLFEVFKDLNRKDYIRQGAAHDMKFSGTSGVSVKFTGGFRRVVDNYQAHLSFQNENSAFFYLMGIRSSQLFLKTKVINRMTKHWEKMGWDRKVRRFLMVTNICNAEKGKIIMSGKKGLGITVNSKIGAPIETMEDIIDLDLSIGTNSEHITIVDSKVTGIPTFQMVRWFKKNRSIMSRFKVV